LDDRLDTMTKTRNGRDTQESSPAHAAKPITKAAKPRKQRTRVSEPSPEVIRPTKEASHENVAGVSAIEEAPHEQGALAHVNDGTSSPIDLSHTDVHEGSSRLFGQGDHKPAHDIQRPSVNLQTFKGTSDLAVDAFIEGVRADEQVHNLERGQILPYVMAALQGTALRRVNRWMNEPGSAFKSSSNKAVQLELLLGYLQKEFGQKPSEALVIAETMKAWRQKPKQTFKEAYDEFYELYDKSSKPEPEAVDLFISGLQRQLRDEIYRKNTDPRSFSAIKDIGFDAEVIVMRTRKHPLDEEEESDAEMTRPSKAARYELHAVGQQPLSMP